VVDIKVPLGVYIGTHVLIYIYIYINIYIYICNSYNTTVQSKKERTMIKIKIPNYLFLIQNFLKFLKC